MGKVILSCSGSGGTGKTTFAVNLGTAAALRGLKVLIVDMNIGRRNADIYLGMEDRILFDLGDVISGLCKLDKAIIQHDVCENLYLLSCPQYRDIDGIGPGHIKALYGALRERFDLVIVDCPVSVSGVLRIFSCGADAALMLTTPDYLSVRNTEALSEKLEVLGVTELYYAINRMDRSYPDNDAVPDLSFITKSINVPLVGIITEDITIHSANNSGCPIALVSGSDMAHRFSDMVGRLIN